MSRKLALSLIALVIISTSMLSVTLEIETAEGVGTIYVYIREDGRIEPSAANITSLDNITYTFTDNNYAYLVIERPNILVDGFGYVLEGTGYGNGVSFRDISNVTVKDLEIIEFECGVNVYNSSNNMFYRNNITNNNDFAFRISHSQNNTLFENRVVSNGGYSYIGYSAIYITYSSNNTVRHNNISDNTHLEGIELWSSSNNTVFENNLKNNHYGIRFISSDNNHFYANNITLSNYEGIYLSNSANNTLYGNLLNGNKYGLGVYGYELNHYLNEIYESNLVDGKPVYYIDNQIKLTVSPSTHPKIGFLALINSTSINVKANNLTNNGQGLLLAYTNKSEITGNNIIKNYNGLELFNSFNNSVHNNNLEANDYRGIYLWNSNNSKIWGNKILNNKDQGLYLSDSSDNTVYGNTIANSEYAIELDGLDNYIYLNNFVNNTQQIDSYDLENFWDNGVEGNYWSDYNGTDSDHDGIGAAPYVIDGNNKDNHPLMGMFYGFNTSSGKNVNVISNSTIESFEYFDSNNTIEMYVSNMSANHDFGFCRVCIPHVLMDTPDVVRIVIDDGRTEALFVNLTLWDNGTHRWVYFAHEHSTHKLIIQSDTTSPTILILHPENNTYNMDDVPLTFTLSEPASWIGYSLDDSANETISGNTTITVPNEGQHNITVYANDSASNMGSSSTVYFSVDTIPPNITDVSRSPDEVLPTDAVHINATVTDAVSGVKQVFLNYTNGNETWIIVEMSNVAGDVWNGTIPAFPYCTNVTYIIMAEDNAGNTITTEEMELEYQYHVIPEFRSILILLLFMTTMMLVVACGRRHSL
jgi:parallel beta-helix repeat protein